MSLEPTGQSLPLQTPRRRPRDRKQHIIRAARDLFVEYGFPNVSMVQIAEAVGVTAGALYRHVATKSELLSLVFEDSFAWLEQPSRFVSLDESIESALARVVENSHLPVLWVREARFLSDEEQEELRHRMRAYSHHYAELLGVRRPDLDEPQRDLLVWAIQSLVSSVGRQLIHTQPSSRLPTVRRAIEAIVEVDMGRHEGERTSQAPRLEPVSRRERLLQAAFDEFARVGYHEASMVAIGAIAGLSGSNLYGYFASKADVLRAVYDRSFHALWLGLNESLRQAGDDAEALTLLVDNYVRLSRRWPRSLEETSGIAELDEFALVWQREYIAEWVVLLRRLQPELDVFQARLRVQIGLVLLSDLYHIPHLRGGGIERDAAILVRAVLFS